MAEYLVILNGSEVVSDDDDYMYASGAGQALENAIGDVEYLSRDDFNKKFYNYGVYEKIRVTNIDTGVTKYYYAKSYHGRTYYTTADRS